MALEKQIPLLPGFTVQTFWQNVDKASTNRLHSTAVQYIPHSINVLQKSSMMKWDFDELAC